MNEEKTPNGTDAEETCQKHPGPKAKRRVILLLAIMAALLLVDIFFVGSPFAGPIKGFCYRTFLTPELIRNGNFADLAYVWSPNAIRENFYFVYEQKKGFYGMKTTITTLVDESFDVYFFTDDGRLTTIADYTRTPYSRRNFQTKHSEKVILGFRQIDADFSFTEKSDETHHKDLRLRFIYEKKK